MSEKAFRVNISFEEELLSGKRITQLNHHFESLFMFLENKTLASNYEYSPYYLDYVESITKQKPKIKKISDGDYDWWGERNSQNKKISSKIYSYEFLAKNNLLPIDAKIIYHKNDLSALTATQIVKTAYSSSGRGIITATKINIEQLEFPVILENLRARLNDYSCYHFQTSNQFIYYQNLIDHNFAYKGSIYIETSIPQVKDWDKLLLKLSLEIGEIDFCVDAYTYEENDKLMFFPLSEINPRKTMGRIGYELWKKYFPQCHVSSFRLFPKSNMGLKQKLEIIKECGYENNMIILSHDEARFEIVLFGANLETELNEMINNYLERRVR
jgi:hypothetical protein